MTRELILGSLLSATLHLVLLRGDFWPSAGPVKIKPTDEVFRIPVTLPPPAEEEPEAIETREAELPPLDLAPPMQFDTPQLFQPDRFVQPTQPPPPPGVTIPRTLSIVPETRNSRAFAGLQVFDPSMLDQTPVPKFQARPHYPPEMRRLGISGEVVVDFIVDPHGNVQQACALRSSRREFEAAALEAVGKWRFRPGRKNGRDVPTHMQVPILFTLNEP